VNRGELRLTAGIVHNLIYLVLNGMFIGKTF